MVTMVSSKTEHIKMMLRQWILDGKFGPHNRLPSERDLCLELGASRVTISRVVSNLIQEGFLYRKVPKGMVYVSGEGTKAGRANSIAVVLGSQVRQGDHNPFYHWVFVGVEEVASRMRMSVLVHQFRGGEELSGLPAGLMGEKIDGIVSGGISWTSETVAIIRKLGKPVVSVQHDGVAFGITSVIPDDEGCVTEAIEHLLSLGHRRIVFLHAPLAVNDNRLRGYQMAFLKNNLSLDPALDIEVTSKDPEEGYHALDRILECPSDPTAVFCENDSLAVGLISACRTRNIKVPEFLSVVGFDDCGLARNVFPPIALTTGRIPIELMGMLAMEQLMALIDKGNMGSGEALALKIMVPTKLIIRETTSRPRDL